MLSTCTKDGGDQALPFRTPADYLLSIPDLRDSPLQTREYSFLANSRVISAISWSPNHCCSRAGGAALLAGNFEESSGEQGVQLPW